MLDALSVAVVDDEAGVREAYRVFFRRRPEFSLVGEAADGRAGVDLYLDKRPDVLLMDLKMPVMSGIDATAAVCAADPHACVMALTTFGTSDFIVAALRAGASGYLLKDCGAAALIQALQDAHAGEMPLAPGVRLALVASLRPRQPSEPGLRSLVTPREKELLQCLAQGLGNQQIAQQMYLSEGSVKQYLNHIADKLGVRSRTQILVKSLRLGIVRLDSLPPQIQP